MYIWNDGEMPANLSSTEKLFKKYSSKPYNPKLANVFFKSGIGAEGLIKLKSRVKSIMLRYRNMK